MAIKVKQINEGILFGDVVEIGAGVQVANTFYSIPGASKTIYKSFSPYHREAQIEFIGREIKRSVSAEFVQAVLETLGKEATKSDTTRNFGFVSSFQVWDIQTNTANKESAKEVVLTHGWMGVRLADTLGDGNATIRLYHISIREDLERDEIIRRIGVIGVNILYDMHQSLLGYARPMLSTHGYVDMVVDALDDGSTEQNMQETIEGLWPKSLVAINAVGQLIRPEDLIRDKKLILFKGSFNPVHNWHRQVIETIARTYPDHVPIFSLSLNTYDKGQIDVKDMERRVRMINVLWYPVLLTWSGYYADILKLIRYNNPNSVIFPVWVDVADKIILDPDTDLQRDFDNKVQFVEFGRRGDKFDWDRPKRPDGLFVQMDSHQENHINSTDIRKLLEAWKFDELKDLLDIRIIQFLS